MKEGELGPHKSQQLCVERDKLVTPLNVCVYVFTPTHTFQYLWALNHSDLVDLVAIINGVMAECGLHSSQLVTGIFSLLRTAVGSVGTPVDDTEAGRESSVLISSDIYTHTHTC